MANYKGKFPDIGQSLYTLDVKEKRFKDAHLPGEAERTEREGYSGPFSICITNKNTGYYPLNYIFMNFINVLQIDT